jgi:hypothetical protein
MARCEVCGNDYEMAFTVTRGGRHYAFDCFECALHALAPACACCGCTVIGPGVERDGIVFCSASCSYQDQPAEHEAPAPVKDPSWRWPAGALV